MSRTLQGALLAAAIVVANAAYVASVMGPLHRSKTVLETDHRTYMEMAWGPPWEARVEAPFCWRLLTPFVAFAVMKTGLGMNAAYYLITNLFLFGFLFVLHAYLATLGFDARYAALGLLLAGLLPGAVRWYEYQYWMTDPLSLFLVALAFLLIQRGRHGWLAATGAVALTNRESWAIVLPYFLLRQLRREPLRRALLSALLVALPGVAVLLLIRYALIPRPAESLVETAREMLAFRIRHLFDNQLYFATLGSFGVLLPLALLLPGASLRYLRDHYDEAAVIVMAYASLALANNTDRLLVYALPVVLPLALRGLRDALERARIPFLPAAAVALGLQGLFYVQTRFHGELGISIYQPMSWTVTLAMLGFWLASQWLLRPGRAAL